MAEWRTLGVITQSRFIFNMNATPMSQIQGALGCNPYTTPFENVAHLINQQSLRTKYVLHNLCRRILNRRMGQLDEITRVAACKVLVALLPKSFATIKSLLLNGQSKPLLTVHFSLFCVLDRVQTVQKDRLLIRKVLAVARKYLMCVKSEMASAAWMAGDMLGDHWQLDLSLPVLMDVAELGMYPAGRRGALHGLEMALDRVKLNERNKLIQFLQQRVRSDASLRVRRIAHLILTKGSPLDVSALSKLGTR